MNRPDRCTRCHEQRMLLTRMVKYVREDKATTERATRLARLTEQVADYLQRTHDPRDMLRADQPAPTETAPGQRAQEAFHNARYGFTGATSDVDWETASPANKHAWAAVEATLTDPRLAHALANPPEVVK